MDTPLILPSLTAQIYQPAEWRPDVKRPQSADRAGLVRWLLAVAMRALKAASAGPDVTGARTDKRGCADERTACRLAG